MVEVTTDYSRRNT